MIHWPTKLLIWLSIPVIKGVGPMAHGYLVWGMTTVETLTHTQGPGGLGLPMSNTTVWADRGIADNEESPVVSVSNLAAHHVHLPAFAMPEFPKGACKIALFWVARMSKPKKCGKYQARVFLYVFNLPENESRVDFPTKISRCTARKFVVF
jgi:hypothetical protein